VKVGSCTAVRAARKSGRRVRTQYVTLNAPFVTVLVPVLPLVPFGTMLNVNVPVAAVAEIVVIVMLPLPPWALATQVGPAAPTVRTPFVGIEGPIG
jgi:hypothetical protein